MNQLKILVFLSIVITNFFPNVSTDAVWVPSSPDLDVDFYNKVFLPEVKDNCTKLSWVRKLAICNYFFSNRIINSKYGQRVYLNRNAFAMYNPPCIAERLQFEHWTNLNKFLVERKIFDCYGRHNPMRTGYYVDDAFNYFYIATGETQKDFYVFRRDTNITYERSRLILIYGIKNLDTKILEIPDTENEEYLLEEHQTLQQLSRNPSVEEIEINYIISLMTGSSSSAIPLCNRSLSEKINACQIVVSHPDTILRNTQPDQNTLQEFPDCVYKYLNYQYVTEHNNLTMEIEMLPCYPSIPGEIGQWYLISGYRYSSLLVFKDYPEYENHVQFFELYENVPGN